MATWVVPGFAEERELGSGGSGRVVAAVHMASGTRVAIKYLLPRLLGDPAFLAGFRAEAELLKSLTDRNVVRLYDYIEAATGAGRGSPPGAVPAGAGRGSPPGAVPAGAGRGSPPGAVPAGVDRGSPPGAVQGAAIVMELVDGVSLFEMITRQGPTGPESALLVLKGSLLGLAAAHALGIVHRDYKPENVLVDREGVSKLTDFGVAARAGHAASAGGTPLYMAPEQWDGYPPAPATDIYAATAVFFECLTGKTPFSGGLPQLQAQHAMAAVPVQLVDEPLRALIARGMAKDPMARPVNATQFMTELEATAAAAYGPDWESRGRFHLAAGAAAVLLALSGAGGAAPVAAGAGSAATSSVLRGGRTAARAGLHGWKAAIVYSAMFAAVFGAVAGGIVGISTLTSHGKSSSSTAAGAAPASASSSAACAPSAGPALAYVTTTGTQASTESVVVRCGTGGPHVVSSFSGAPFASPAWSPDGTQLAWLDSSSVYVATASAGTWSMRHWACESCGGLAFQGDHAVTVALDHQQSDATTTLIPQLLVFPATGSGQPTALAVNGISNLGTDMQFTVLGSASPASLVVQYGQASADGGGGSHLLYQVSTDGQATQYGTGQLAQSPFVGSFGDFAASPATSQAGFITSSGAGACTRADAPHVLDTATGTVTSPKLPAGGGPDGYAVIGMWFDRAGTPYVSLAGNPGDCSISGTPTAFKLAGGAWVQAGTSVDKAAYGPGNWIARATGITDLTGGSTETLTISGGPGTTPVTVSNVPAFGSFAWEP